MKIQVSESDGIDAVPVGWSAAKLKYHAVLNPKCSTQVSEDAEVTFTPMENVKNGYFIPRTEKYWRFVGNSQYSEYEEGDIAFAKVTPCFENDNIAIMQGLINGKGFGSSELFVIRPTSIVLKYLLYLLQTPHFKANGVASMTGTGGLKRVSSDAVRNYKFALPSAEIQNLIASYLDTKCTEIDKVVEQTRATVEEYKKLKQAIITETVTKGVRGPRPMKPSGVEWIGDIPEEWEICSIKLGVTKVGSGKTPSGGAEVYLNEGVLFLRSQNIYDTGLQLDNATYISESTDEEMSGTRVYSGDVLLNITGGSIGRCCVYPSDLPPANVNQHVCIIRTVNSMFTADYMHYFWISFAGKTSIQLYQTGGNREGMSADAIKNTRIPRMAISEQREIAAYLDTKCAEIERIIEKKEQLIEELGSYKKSLIYEYVTGKKEVTA